MDERLVKANENLRTVPIKGKNYVMVKDRVTAFRREYENWSIITEIKFDDGTEITMKASVLDEEGNVMSTGHASEVRGSSNINKTSALENAETGAIGRALGLLGIGIDDSFGSADEVANAQKQQAELGEQVSEDNVKKLRQIMEMNGVDEKTVCDYFHVDKLELLTNEEWAKAVKKASIEK